VRLVVPIIVTAVLVPVGTTAAAPSARTLDFTKVVHHTAPIKNQAFLRLPLGASALIVDGLDNSVASYPLLNEGSVSAIQRTPWRRQFVLAVFSLWPTRGYDVAVRRVTVQQIGGGLEQLCVVAGLKAPRPGRVVLQERTLVYDVVRVAREHGNAPSPHAVVVRSTRGALLDWTKDGRPVRPGVCHAR
jgi:hypothetical protein